VPPFKVRLFPHDKFSTIQLLMFLTSRIWRSQNIICMNTSKVSLMLLNGFQVGLYMVIVISVFFRLCVELLLVLSKGNINISLNCLYVL